jgi:hypothetical protein
MLLAFLYWLSDGSSLLTIPVNPSEGVILRLPPLLFQSPVSLPLDREDSETDEDDPQPEASDGFEGELEEEDELEDEDDSAE